jgi:hypothetical protein
LCDCFQENKKDEIVKPDGITFSAFHPKALNVVCDLAGLLAWLFAEHLPVDLAINLYQQWYKHSA